MTITIRKVEVGGILKNLYEIRKCYEDETNEECPYCNHVSGVTILNEDEFQELKKQMEEL